MTYSYHHTRLLKGVRIFDARRLDTTRRLMAAQRLAHVDLLNTARANGWETVGQIAGGRWQRSELGDKITVTVERYVTWSTPSPIGDETVR